MVRVASMVTHSVTCGAVNADCVMAPAIILRTPLIGSRVSRSPVAAACLGCAGAVPAPSRSARVTDPLGPVPVTVARSMPRSLASLRTGGLARARGVSTSLVARCSTTPYAGTDSSGSAASTSGEARPVSKDACAWMWVARVPDATLRGRRVGPRSALLRPTRLSPSPPPDAAGLERSISISSSARRRAAAPDASAGSPTAMIGVPTATVVPSSTRIAVTVPA